jgi:hypothetical protein
LCYIAYTRKEIRFLDYLFQTVLKAVTTVCVFHIPVDLFSAYKIFGAKRVEVISDRRKLLTAFFISTDDESSKLL